VNILTHDTEKIRIGDWRCDCHSKHAVRLDTQDKEMKKMDDENIRVWQALDKKVPNKLFYVLVALVVSMLGFQWVNYDKLSVMDKSVAERMAIIETSLSAHTNYHNGTPKLTPRR
jgi:hypothetical protein